MFVYECNQNQEAIINPNCITSKFIAGFFFDQALVIYIKFLTLFQPYVLYVAATSFKKLNLIYILFVLFLCKMKYCYYSMKTLYNCLELLCSPIFCYSMLLILDTTRFKSCIPYLKDFLYHFE
jgi:hypothetical protein